LNTVTLYHNPRCSKSRRALELFRERGVALDIVDYQATPPGRDVLTELIRLSGAAPIDFVRVGDDAFRSSGESVDEFSSADEVAAILAKNPALMQRPVARAGQRVVVGRPPERCLDVLEGAAP
jgi:arsenate reductase